MMEVRALAEQTKKMEADSAEAVATAKKAATDAWAAATAANTFNTEGKGIHD
jgi:hypothetical protein